MYFYNMDTDNAKSKIFKFFSDIYTVPVDQISRIFFHGVILSCIIMGFWLLDSLKDPILELLIGIEFQPTAKLISVVTTLILVSVYDYMTCMLSKSMLFHIISFLFGVLFMILSALISDPHYGIQNKVVADRGTHRFVGWLFYFSVEAYGSLMVAMFWSYTNSVMDLEQAKGCYGIIISIAQIGAISGATLATHSNYFGIPQLVLLGSIIVLSVSLLVKIYHIVFVNKSYHHSRRNQTSTVINSEDAIPRVVTDIMTPNVAYSTYTTFYINSFYKFISGFYEGLIIIWQHHYVIKILLISCLYEIVITVLDYEFKLRGAISIKTSTHNIDATSNSKSQSLISNNKNNNAEDVFATLLGHFGQLTNFISLTVSVFVFSFVVKRLGVKMALLIFPTILFMSVILSNLGSSLNLLFILVSLLKSLVFSLHEPLKELLYIPTSQPIKFKAKAWIDVFGARLFKAIGSVITFQSHGSIKTLKTISELPNIILSICLIIVTFSVGTEFEKHIHHNYTVGESENYNKERIKNQSSKSSSGNNSNSNKAFDFRDVVELFEGPFVDDDFNDELDQQH